MDRRIFAKSLGFAASVLSIPSWLRAGGAELRPEQIADKTGIRRLSENGGNMLPQHSNLPDIQLRVFNSGWIPVHKKVALSGGPNEKIEMPALFAMIRHPDHGVVLYDTGYNTKFYEATRHLPYRIMRVLTPARITPQDNADRQLQAVGIEPEQVKTVILGHGHVDHVPGIGAFPGAKVVIDGREWQAMQGPALKIFTHGYVKSLYRDMNNQREIIDFDILGKPYGPFEQSVDLFDDGSMILIPLPGHTVGQMGLLVNLADGRRFFFIGDAAWLSENYLQMKPPMAIARIILDSQKDYKNTLELIHDFHHDHPEVVIVPAHCPATWEKLIEMGLTN